MSNFTPENPSHDSLTASARRFDMSQSDRGEVSGGLLRRVGAGLAIGSLVAGSYYGFNQWGENAGQPLMSVSANDSTSHGEAKTLLIDPIELGCVTSQVYDLKGFVVKFQMLAAGHQVPQFGGQVTFKDPTRLNVDTCQRDTSKLAKKVAIEPTQVVDPITGYKHTLVQVPISTIEVRAQYPVGNKTEEVDSYTGLKYVGGLAGILSAEIKVPCLAVTLNNTEACDAFAGHIDGFKRNFDTKAANTAEEDVLKYVQDKGSVASWANTELAIRDAYITQAINKTGNAAIAQTIDVQFVDDNGKVTNAMPDFAKDSFDAYRKTGVLAPDDNLEIDTSNFKIVPPAPYVPKYPLNPTPAATATPSTTTSTGAKQ